ncbi:unnamed protein product [Darwinula stevensoni]|uniref:Uncharacterized protein n=1 Tax=Darwinula stevensoni TaxID=69355 RepID=A0A7R8X877_9CRUS|nr:unnamed protein product [Darwinula stevensoni]CAG0889810.1 unnamed protein product [Darwinula stevensoni]
MDTTLRMLYMGRGNRLYASPVQVAKGETVSLSSIHAMNQNIFLVVDTTVPIPRIPRKQLENGSPPRPTNNRANQNRIRDTGIEIAPRAEEPKSTKGPVPPDMDDVPDWVKADLAEEAVPMPSPLKKRLSGSDERKKKKPVYDPYKNNQQPLPQSPFEIRTEEPQGNDLVRPGSSISQKQAAFERDMAELRARIESKNSPHKVEIGEVRQAFLNKHEEPQKNPKSKCLIQ